ncbi:hypothetical protein MNBD_GAMMA18-1324 [hydrothermal vent metagenome]|uniref:Uncharacterized protein n=1 Tax=hydrothermal vent metagenome TaxID=652676 RepID=A0A3B1A6M3_9ZZZZ
MKKKIFFGGIGGVFLTIAGLMLYDMSKMEIEVLMLCSTNRGGILIPSDLCKYYLVNYRINEKGIKELSEGGGLDVVLNIEESAAEYELAKMFLARGLDVDGANHAGGKDVTPLQAAVMYNDVRRVNFLLEYGANIHLSEGYGMTPIDIARKFHKAGSELEDRSEIIQILSDAEKP